MPTWVLLLAVLAGRLPADSARERIDDLYDSQGRRDPFADPRRAESSPPGRSLSDLLVEEVALKGILKTSRGYTAAFLGPDGRTHFVRVGERLRDGVVAAIDDSTVTLRQELRDPVSAPRVREVKKRL
jgi:Tfp pilus assembly protein PilP